MNEELPDEARRELDTEYLDYRARVRLASQAIVFGLVVVFVAMAALPSISTSDRTALLATAVLDLLSGIAWFVIVPRGFFGAWRIFVASSIAQAVLAVLITMTRGADSVFFPFFLLPTLVLILSGDLRQVLLMAGVAIAALVVTTAVQGTPGTGPVLAIRVIELATFAGFGALGARAFGDTRRTLAARAAVLATAYQAATNTALVDPGTGLPNRRYFEQRIGPLVDEGKRRGLPFAIVTFVMRATGSSGVFDAEQHAPAVAATIGTCLLPHETLVRLGTDDFLVLLAEGDAARAHDLAAAVERAVAGHTGVAVRWSVVPVSLDATSRSVRKRVAAMLAGGERPANG